MAAQLFAQGIEAACSLSLSRVELQSMRGQLLLQARSDRVGFAAQLRARRPRTMRGNDAPTRL